MQKTVKFDFLDLHPKNRESLRRVVKLLLVLGVTQISAWLLPTLPEFKGIPNYLPLHTFMEMVSIIVSMMVFSIGWNSRNQNLSGNIALLACASFSVGLLDFFHTISYGGMPDFISPNDAQKHLNFWLSARTIESIILLVVSIRPWEYTYSNIKRHITFASFLIATALIWWVVIYHQSWMPDTFIPGQGLTKFKKCVEYFVIAIDLTTAAFFWNKMRSPQTFNVVLLFGATCVLAMSEFYFTLYTTMTGSYNVLGHVYKVIAYLMIYRAIVVDVIEKPYKQLKIKEEQLSNAQKLARIGNWRVVFGIDASHDVWTESKELRNIWGLSDDVGINSQQGFAKIPPEDQQRTQQIWESAKRGHGPNEWEHRIIVNGNIKWINVVAKFKFDTNGKPIEASGTNQDVTERKLAEATIYELNRDFVSFLENASDFIYLKDINSRIRFCSQTLAKITGHKSWRDMIGKHDMEIFPKDTAQIYYEEELPIFLEGKSILNKEDPYYDESGAKRWVSTNKWPLLNQDRTVVGLFGISRDITERKTIEEKLRTLSTAVEQSPVSVIIVDLDANIEYVNPRFTEVTGYTAEEAIGQNPRILQSGLTPKEIYLELWDKVVNGQIWHGEMINKRKNGEIYWEDAHIAPVRDDSGIITHYVATKADITDRKSMEEKVQHLAQYDVLTDLPNRLLFSDRLQQALAIAKRDKAHLALMFIDLDKFKPVNDEFGHQMGDLLLKEAAKRMLECVRESDTIARLGGDEFVVLLPSIESEQDALLVAEKIRHSLNQPFALLGKHLFISSSTGIVIYPEHGIYEEELFMNADVAMYSAKAGGRNAAILFKANMRKNT